MPMDTPQGASRWLEQAVREIELASQEDASEVSDKFTIGDYTPTYTLNPASATATDVANVLATLLTDMKKRGRSRGA